MFLMQSHYTILGILLGGADNMRNIRAPKVKFAGGAKINGKNSAFKVMSQITSLVS